MANLRRGNLARAISRSNLLFASLLIVALVAVGTGSYHVIEGWSLLDALYATVITITTVGYGDFSPQTISGRLFAVFFTITAIGIAGYAISTVAAFVIEREHRRVKRLIQEQKVKQIASLNNHIIICGGGYVGKRVANEFYRIKEPFLVIENREDVLRWTLLYLHKDYVDKKIRQYRELDYVKNDTSQYEVQDVGELAESAGVLYLQEDATHDSTLLKAGIARARGLVAAMDSDKDNLFVVLSARQLARRLSNPGLNIVARVVDEENKGKLWAAGADRLVLPNVMGGFQLASNMLHPELATFWDQMLYRDDQMLRFADMHIDKGSHLVGHTVSDVRRQHGQLVIAIKRNGQYDYNPDPNSRLEEGDILIVFGRRDVS